MIGQNAQIVVGDANAISLGDNATIDVGSGALVQNTSQTSNGLYNTGADTIEFRNNSTLTVEQGATVLSSGAEHDGEAVNPEGSGNLIVNNGTIQGINAAAIWFQNTTGLNTIVNNATGVIEVGQGGRLGQGNVMGASGNGAVDFTNRGTVLGNLVFAGGNDALHLYTGSTISGTIDGGGGTNLLTLNGAGSDVLPSRITNFQTLQKQDSGTWTINDPLSSFGFTSAEVQQGTLVLAGNNTQYAGSMLVDSQGTLQGNAQTLTPAITDNGLVQFVQNVDDTYTGSISGTGAVEKDGAGTLILAPSTAGSNTYSGGTVLNQGVLQVSADNVMGDPTGAITFNGGTLQLSSSFNLAATRAMTIAAGGGTIDTQQYQSTIAQNIAGAGALTKIGSGTLVLNGVNTYNGGTTVSAGTLVLGDAAHPSASLASGASVASGAAFGGYGTVNGDVTNNGTIAVANALSSFSSGGNGGFTINGRLTNAGTVQLGGAGVGNTLTVQSYVGQNGTIRLNTVLGG
ncbi:autotransporter-associated beta strand repeat-containing protein, partial [Trinickia fusca]|uniref:autotransporter-associated beta strand repeat-containing protein n=1 Tax=Trinickia fusca TaxID=2419777 RepID=UPI001FE5AC7D